MLLDYETITNPYCGIYVIIAWVGWVFGVLQGKDLTARQPQLLAKGYKGRQFELYCPLLYTYIFFSLCSWDVESDLISSQACSGLFSG